jgi:hypothetical protein
MTPQEEYNLHKGTPIGEIRYEVYNKYGLDAYSTAHYGWHNERVSQTILKTHTLVNSSPIQFLTATITLPLVDIIQADPTTGIRPNVPPVYAPDTKNPSSLHLEWTNANIPFLPKDEVDKLGLTYNLP